MKMILRLLVVFMFCSSCENKDERSTNFSKQHLQGDWINKTQIVFSFADSLTNAGTPFGFFSPFIVNNDTLSIKQKDEWQLNGDKYIREYKSDWMQFYLQRVTADSLILYPINKLAKETFLNEGVADSLLIFTKAIKRNTLDIKTIFFSTFPGFGTGSIPELDIEIQADGKILLQSWMENSTLKEGIYEGRLNEQILTILKERLTQIDELTLNQKYSASYTCSHMSNLIIYTQEGKRLETLVYGYENEPKELRILMHWLMELYHHTELTRVNKEFGQVDFESRQALLPPVLKNK